LLQEFHQKVKLPHPPVPEPVVILITLLSTAFFSGIEIAFVSASKLRIELRNKQGHFTAKILAGFVKEPSRFISTTLLGNAISLVVYGIFMELLLKRYIQDFISVEAHEFTVIFISSLISTIIVLVTAEFIPKVIFRLNPDFMLELFALPFLFFYYLFSPVVNFVVWLSKWMIRVFFKSTISENVPIFSKIDLDHYVSQSASLDLEDDADVDTEIFKNALDFGTVKVRNFLVPRTELVAMDIHSSIDDLHKLFVESGHSKILIYRDSIDNIIGYVHQVEMFNEPDSIGSILLPIHITHETVSAHQCLNELNKQRKSVALVVDEFGGTAGIVTVEDIIENIFGDINDEHDTEEFKEQQINEHEFIFSARLEIKYLNDTYDLNLPEGEYDTLGGFIISGHEDIPEVNEMIHIDRFEFHILSMHKTRIDVVKMNIL
jgi:putative hemolysin